MMILSSPTVVLLDSGPLGLITNPKQNPEAIACKAWQRRLVLAGHLVLLPEIIDYEHRRELLLAGLVKAERTLDAWKSTGFYLPLATADRFALDADVILAAQAATLDPNFWGVPGAEVVIATMNVGHLTRFTAAEEWQNIRP